MSLVKGSTVGKYTLSENFVPGNNGRFARAVAGAEHFFVKEFKGPKYPPDQLQGPIRASKLRRCGTFENRHKRLVGTLMKFCARGGNIVMPVDFFRFGLAYYHVAPLIDTTTLQPSDIARASYRDKLLLLRLLARSLITLQKCNVVHGDLKPGNILITRPPSGLLAPKIIDFDGAYFAGEPPDDPDDMTFDATYMAPELLLYDRACRGEGVRRPDSLTGSADIFTVGLLIHEYWAGRLPGTNCAATVLSGHELPYSFGDMPAGLAACVRAALCVNPRARPAINDIDKAIEDATTPRPAPVAPKAAPTVRMSGARMPSFIRADPKPRASGLSERAPAPIEPPAASRPKESSAGVTVRFSTVKRRDKDG